MDERLKDKAIIALFLGWEETSPFRFSFPNLYSSYGLGDEHNTGTTEFNISCSMFDVSLDWLYPVYRKCITVADEMDNEDLYIKLDIIQDALLDAEPVEVLFDRIVEFINLHNEIKDGGR